MSLSLWVKYTSKDMKNMFWTERSPKGKCWFFLIWKTLSNCAITGGWSSLRRQIAKLRNVINKIFVSCCGEGLWSCVRVCRKPLVTLQGGADGWWHFWSLCQLLLSAEQPLLGGSTQQVCEPVAAPHILLCTLTLKAFTFLVCKPRLRFAISVPRVRFCCTISLCSVVSTLAFKLLILDLILSP